MSAAARHDFSAGIGDALVLTPRETRCCVRFAQGQVPLEQEQGKGEMYSGEICLSLVCRMILMMETEQPVSGFFGTFV